MAMGATTHAHAFYTECVKKATGLGQYNLCRRYLRKLEELSKSDLAIVTHDYLLLMLESGKIPEGSLLIFDEDLLMSLQKQIKTISAKTLKTLVQDLEDSIEFSEMTDIINKVKNRVECIEQHSDRQEEVVLFAPESELSQDEIKSIIHFLVTGSSAVFREQYKEIAAILSADGFVMGKDNHELVLHLINNWKLPNQYKYIVLTASGSEKLYRRLAVNSKINDFNYSPYPNNIALMGDIFQITDKNYSRTLSSR
ncbi:hypothetical protein STA3757_35370 [Stanieria sp. NIES-3757]|nr:hypothetical protein STA3757_35370 [Stanieria sp. NIES-3757]